ncbi:MAG: hypothetical protein RLZZ135_321 [Cyanobacteriota bacterium]|jgi:PIN domain nuclease of toxin-antitoxin system
MRVLIDTHALLWYLQGDANLSNLALDSIENKDNDVFVSIISLWEISIKLGLGKLELQRPFDNLEADLQRLDIKILPIAFAELDIYRSLPLHHRDPFDRILIAQSIGNSLNYYHSRFFI